MVPGGRSIWCARDGSACLSGLSSGVCGDRDVDDGVACCEGHEAWSVWPRQWPW